MIVKCLECPKCGQLVYSRARHDMRSCSCGAIAVDGGFDYFRTVVALDIKEELRMEEVLVDASKAELYEDWNKGTNKFGIIERE